MTIGPEPMTMIDGYRCASAYTPVVAPSRRRRRSFEEVTRVVRSRPASVVLHGKAPFARADTPSMTPSFKFTWLTTPHQ